MRAILETELTAFKLTDTESGKSVLFQTDWDFPSLARHLGWEMTTVQRGKRQCDHSGTDGTIKCPECGLLPSSFISAAAAWLHEQVGDSFPDVEEYFANENNV